MHTSKPILFYHHVHTDNFIIFKILKYIKFELILFKLFYFKIFYLNTIFFL